MRWLLEYPSAQALSWRCMVIPSWSLMWTQLAVRERYIRRCWYCCRIPRNRNWGKDVIQFDEDVDEVVPMRSTCLPPAGANPHFLYDHPQLKFLQWRRYMSHEVGPTSQWVTLFYFLFPLSFFHTPSITAPCWRSSGHRQPSSPPTPSSCSTQYFIHESCLDNRCWVHR
jgi:hypothetical protein